MRITSATRVSRRRPSAPPGCERAKSSAEKPRASSSASASASPSASAAVVLAVGASPSGQASASTAASRCTSAACASELCSLPVIAMSVRALALQMRRQRDELVGLAGIRQHHDDVVGRDHAEVAVAAPRPDARRTPACRWTRAWRRACARCGPTCRCRTRRRGRGSRGSARPRRRTARRAAPPAPSIARGLGGEHVARERERARGIDGDRRRRRAGLSRVHRRKYSFPPRRGHSAPCVTSRREPRDRRGASTMRLARPTPMPHALHLDPRPARGRGGRRGRVPARAPAADPRLPARRHRRRPARARLGARRRGRRATSPSSASCS